MLLVLKPTEVPGLDYEVYDAERRIGRHAYIRNRPRGSAMVLDHNRAMANTVFIGLWLRRVPRAGDRGF